MEKMDSEQNSQPLLDTPSDSEDLHEDSSQIRHRTPTDSASGSRFENSSHSDINDSDTHDIQDLESNTEDDDTQNLFKATNTVPYDRFGLTYMIFYLLGMTTLLPWNFFITAEDVSFSPAKYHPHYWCVRKLLRPKKSGLSGTTQSICSLERNVHL